MTLSRRSFLISSSAAAVAATIPLPALSAPEVAVGVDLATKPDLTAFIVGTPGEFDWHVVFAKTEREALLQGLPELFQRWNHVAQRWEIDPSEPIDTDECSERIARVPQWDGRDPDSISSIDWLHAGFGHTCDRCGNETHAGSGMVVADEVVCEDCLTLADRIAAEDWDEIEDDLANRIDAAADLPAERARLEADGHLAALEAAGVWSKVVARVEADS